MPGLDVTAGVVFSDETHTISAALGGQGVALMSLALVAGELEAGSLVAPFGPVFEAEPFHFVYPEAVRDDGWITTLRDWILGLPLTTPREALSPRTAP